MTAQSGLGFSGIVAIQIPVGGAAGTVLTKLSAANYDYDWQPGGGGGAPTNAEYVVLSLDATLTDERVLTAGAGLTLTDGGAGGNVTLDVGAGTGIVVNANDVQLDLADNRNIDHSAVVLTAGAGLVGTGDITASRTFDVVANADGSIVVNADDIQVGVLATDAQHGNRGGGSLHALAVPSGAAGFLSGADKQIIDDLGTTYVTIGAPAQTITSVKTFEPFGTGILGQDDIIIGDSADYGLMRIGAAEFGRTNFNAAALDLDGSMISFNTLLPATSNIEFAWADGTGSLRFALAVPAVGNATYNPRSMLIAGPAVLDDTVVTVGYWQTTNNIFDNLVCDTVGQGADLGVQNDLEVEGTIYIDNIEESTPGAAVTLTADEGTGSGSIAWQGDDLVWAPASSPASSYVIGFGATGDPTTPLANRINLTGLSGFSFIFSNAGFPQWIIGNTDPTTAVFWDGNGNKDIRMNTLDTGFDQDNVVYFGYGGINLQDQTGDAIFLRSPAAVAGTFTITLPPTDGNTGQVLVNQDGAATLDWEDPAINYIMPIWAEENAGLAAGATEWAYGNGANTPLAQGPVLYVPAGLNAEIVAVGLSIPSGTATVQVVINGVAQGAAANATHTGPGGTINTLVAPVPVVNGDILNFQTQTVTAATGAPAQAIMYVRIFS